MVGSKILPEAGESAGTTAQEDVGAEGADFNKSKDSKSTGKRPVGQ